jgi:hypothetical protein
MLNRSTGLTIVTKLTGNRNVEIDIRNRTDHNQGQLLKMTRAKKVKYGKTLSMRKA